MNNRPQEIHRALTAIGVPVQGVNADDTVICAPGYEKLTALVIASIDKGGGTPEWIALRDFLGIASAEWQAYLDARRAPIKALREARFKSDTDAVLLKAFEVANGAKDVTIDGTVYRLPTRAALLTWEASKLAIRNQLKYPDEG